MRKPKTLRRVRYTVRGSGSFPSDMLRYDCGAHPATPEDWEWIKLTNERRRLNSEPVELMLEVYLIPDVRSSAVGEENGVPCKGRWRSFMWEVTEVYPIEKIPFECIPEQYLPSRYKAA